MPATRLRIAFGCLALCGLALAGAASSPPLWAADWNQFRGPQGNGVAAPATIPTTWSESENLLWRVTLAGAGWSQPIVVGQQVLVTQAVSDPPMRPKDFKTGVSDPRSMPGSKAEPPEVTITWQVAALDLRSGETRWTRTAAEGRPRYAIHPSNTYATETPAADEQGVYAYFGATGTVAALDWAGQPLWTQQLGPHPMTENFGTGSSPVLVDGILVIQSFCEDQAVLVAFDTRSGAELWRVARDKPASSWSTPFVWRSRDRSEVIASGGKLMTSHDPRTGAELWRIEGIDVPSTSSITADAERIYFGFRSPFASGPLYALLPGATGDQSPESGSKKIRCEAWSRPGAAPGMPTPVVAGGSIYVINGGVLSCHDAATGEPHYKQRLPKLGSIAASPVAVDDKVVIVGETGHAVVIQTGPTYVELGTPQLPDTFWSSPAVADGRLLLRGIDTLYCVGQ